VTPESAKAVAAFLFADGPATLSVQGTSMSPTYRPGASVRIRPLTTQPRPGRCYVYRSGEHLVIHRLVAMHHGHSILVGDSATLYESIAPSQIIAEPAEPRSNHILERFVHATNVLLMPWARRSVRAATLRRRLVRGILSLRGPL
jgi:hypothetical protein